MKFFPKLFLATLALSALCVCALAQTPPSGAWVSGDVTSVGSTTMTIQSLTLTVSAGALFTTVNADGTISQIPFSEINVGDSFHGRFIFISGTPTIVSGEVGNHFFWHGVVTAVNSSGGALQSIQLDNTAVIFVSQAKFVNLSGGSASIQVGSVVGVSGLAANGVFAAQWVNAGGVDFSAVGQVGSLLQDQNGNVTGFTFTSGTTSVFVSLDSSTAVYQNKRPVSANTLAPGETAKVSGWTLPDGSVQAWNIRIR